MKNKIADEVNKKTAKSLKWQFALQFLQKVFFFIAGIVLARLLAPRDFGVVAMALTLDTITWIVLSIGVSSAIIHYQDNVKDRLEAGFWLILLLTGIMVALQILAAPFVADFYRTPVLKDVIIISAMAMFIFSFGAVQKAILIKGINFKKVAIIESVVNISKNILYIIFAFLGFGLWSFIYPKVIGAILSVILFWSISSWRPKFKFHFSYWKEMIIYSKNVVCSSLLDYIINNSSYILLGRFVGPNALGLYTFSYDKSMLMVNSIAMPVSIVKFPGFAKLQEEKEELKKNFLATIKFITLISFPYCLGQIVAGDVFITFVFGEKWRSAVIFFQLLIVYAMFRSVVQCVNPLLNGVGKPEITLRWNFIYAPIFLTSLYFGYKWLGTLGVALSASIIGSLGSICYFKIATMVLDWDFKEIIKSLIPSFNCALLMAMGLYNYKVWVLGDLNNFWALLSLFLLACAIYFGALSYFYPVRFAFFITRTQKFFKRGEKNELAKEKA